MDVPAVRLLIESSRPDRRRVRGSTLTLLGASLLLGALIADDKLTASFPGAWLLPQLLIGVLAVVLIQRARRQRELLRRMEQALEAVPLRQWAEAKTGLEAVLKRPLRSVNARAESLLALAFVAEAEESYDASQNIYESLLEEGAGDPLQLHAARVGLAGVLLRNGQVTDAVSLIERLERASLPDSLRAQIEMLSLFKEVFMGQAESGVLRADERRKLFREHLGTKAGYGYGLLAAAFDRIKDSQSAQAFWHDATLLVAPAELVKRFRDLAPTARRYTATENPL